MNAVNASSQPSSPLSSSTAESNSNIGNCSIASGSIGSNTGSASQQQHHNSQSSTLTPRAADDARADSYNVGPYDVMCGRHRLAFNNVGNRRFRVTVSLSVEQYMKAATRKDKSRIILSVVDIVKSTGGRFIKWNNREKMWLELNEKEAREKVGHALRDMSLVKDQAGISSGSRRSSNASSLSSQAAAAAAAAAAEVLFALSSEASSPAAINDQVKRRSDSTTNRVKSLPTQEGRDKRNDSCEADDDDNDQKIPAQLAVDSQRGIQGSDRMEISNDLKNTPSYLSEASLGRKDRVLRMTARIPRDIPLPRTRQSPNLVRLAAIEAVRNESHQTVSAESVAPQGDREMSIKTASRVKETLSTKGIVRSLQRRPKNDHGFLRYPVESHQHEKEAAVDEAPSTPRRSIGMTYQNSYPRENQLSSPSTMSTIEAIDNLVVGDHPLSDVSDGDTSSVRTDSLDNIFGNLFHTELDLAERNAGDQRKDSP